MRFGVLVFKGCQGLGFRVLGVSRDMVALYPYRHCRAGVLRIKASQSSCPDLLTTVEFEL